MVDENIVTGREPISNYRDLALFLKNKWEETPNSLRLNCKFIFLSTSLDLGLLLMMEKCPCTIPMRSRHSDVTFENISEVERDEYAKHIKRSYILEMWSVTEVYIQKTCEELLGLDVKGRFGFIKSTIKEIIKRVKKDGHYGAETDVMKMLNKVFKICPKDSAVMDKLRKLLDKVSNDTFDLNHIIAVFKLFKEWRNAMHNNFIASKPFKSEVEWYPNIVAGQEIEVNTEHLRKMTDILVDFCEKMDREYSKILQHS